MALYYKRAGFKIAEEWFSDYSDELHKHNSIVKYHDCFSKMNVNYSKVLFSQAGSTLHTDLTKDIAYITSLFTSTVRNEIRRAEKDGVTCDFLSSELKSDISLLNDFEAEYAKMHSLKNMSHTSSVPFLSALANNGMLSMTIAKINGAPVAYHCYIVHKNITRLLYSVSVFRNYEDKNMKNAIGRANKYLHYRDIEYFKNRKLTIYDWGGYGKTPDTKPISDFKLSFGGTETLKYEYTIASSMIVAFIYRIYQRVLRMRYNN